jgi:Mg2+-importing ATPase
MAQRKVIVKKLSSIENLGSMNLLCCDKTGTLTSGELKVHSYCDMVGCQSDTVLLYAYINAYYQTGFNNPIDEAIIAEHQFDLTDYQKLDEVPYDFIRKRLSVLFSKDNVHLMCHQRCTENILDACLQLSLRKAKLLKSPQSIMKFNKNLKILVITGLRTLGLAYRYLGAESSINKDSETK